MLPGLWMSAVSRMGCLAVSCKQQLSTLGDPRASQLVIPPVFENCTKILPEQDQERARDLYWEVISDPKVQGPKHVADAVGKLRRAVELNPYIAEPHVLLAQLYIHSQEWSAAQKEARRGLELFVEWGTCWDKRMGWDAWVAWTRVCLEAAAAQTWPSKPLGVLSLGLVGGL